MAMHVFRLSRSVLIAIVLAVVLLIWLASGERQAFRDEAPEATDAQQISKARVEVEQLHAEMHQGQVQAQGALLPWREVALRARVAGVVSRRLVEDGQRVAAGATLLELDQEDLPAQLARSAAELALRQAELEAAQRLEGRQLVSANELLRLRAAAAQARAEEAALQQRLAHMRPAAPFDGVLNRIDAESGDLFQVGDVFAELVDDSRLRATAWVGQREIAQLVPGLPVQVTLLDGRLLEGEVNFVASRASETTRSYRVEVTVDNPQRLRIAGASATLAIQLPEQLAHRFSPALLVLDEQGRMGVKYLDEQNRVQFGAVRLLSASTAEVWVAGLPPSLRLITLGGGFVEPGDEVDAVAVTHTTAAE